MINHRDACRMRYDELVSMLIESLVLPTKLSEVLEMLKFGSKPSQPIGDHSHFLAMSFSSKRTFWPSLIWLSCAMTIVSCEASLIAWLRYAKPGVASLKSALPLALTRQMCWAVPKDWKNWRSPPQLGQILWVYHCHYYSCFMHSESWCVCRTVSTPRGVGFLASTVMIPKMLVDTDIIWQFHMSHGGCGTCCRGKMGYTLLKKAISIGKIVMTPMTPMDFRIHCFQTYPK